MAKPESQVIPDSLLGEGPAGQRRKSFEEFYFGDGGKKKLPFSLDLDPSSLKCGFFCGVVKANNEQPFYALKVYLPPSETDQNLGGETTEAVMIAFNQARADKQEYERLLESPLGVFLPPTSFLIGHGLESQPVQINLQPWIEGKEIGRFTLGEIKANLPLLYALGRFARKVLRHFWERGEMVDYWGFSVKKGSSLIDKIKAFSLFASRNLIWDGNSLYLVDVTCHQRGLTIRSRGRGLIRLLISLGLIVYDYFTVQKILRRNIRFLNSNENQREYLEGFKEIIERLEGLKKCYGLDYRIVGGIAAQAIFGEPVLPFRPNGSKRDVDVLVLNPDVCKKELEELEKWAGRESLNLLFPSLSLNYVREKGFSEKTPPQVFFIQEGGTFYLTDGKKYLEIPSSALKEEYLEVRGVRFCTFPSWFHYFLYLTRNNGYIRRRDIPKVWRLKKIALNTDEGKELNKRIGKFLRLLSIGRRFLNALRIEINWIMGR